MPSKLSVSPATLPMTLTPYTLTSFAIKPLAGSDTVSVWPDTTEL